MFPGLDLVELYKNTEVFPHLPINVHQINFGDTINHLEHGGVQDIIRLINEGRINVHAPNTNGETPLRQALNMRNNQIFGTRMWFLYNDLAIAI